MGAEDTGGAKVGVGKGQGCVSTRDGAGIIADGWNSHFKLDNKLREAEPKIKHIADYEKQVDKLYHNQLLW